MLTDLESVFRSLKGKLGLRPVFQSTADRSTGHLFITVLAYQAVQVLRTKLQAAGGTRVRGRACGRCWRCSSV